MGDDGATWWAERDVCMEGFAQRSTEAGRSGTLADDDAVGEVTGRGLEAGGQSRRLPARCLAEMLPG